LCITHVGEITIEVAGVDPSAWGAVPSVSTSLHVGAQSPTNQVEANQEHSREETQFFHMKVGERVVKEWEE
jgi:hypothetical protein